MLRESAINADRARLAAGLAKGAARRRYAEYARIHHRNCLAISDRLHGPVSADIAAMSIDELAAALQS